MQSRTGNTSIKRASLFVRCFHASSFSLRSLSVTRLKDRSTWPTSGLTLSTFRTTFCPSLTCVRMFFTHLDEISDINTYNGTVIYRCEPLHQFNKNSGVSLQLQTNTSLRGSGAFAIAAKIKDGDTIDITYGDQTTRKTFKIDATIKGTSALYPTFDDGITIDPITSGYRFKQVQIKKVDA